MIGGATGGPCHFERGLRPRSPASQGEASEGAAEAPSEISRRGPLRTYIFVASSRSVRLLTLTQPPRV
jgi:hypothetical protein